MKVKADRPKENSPLARVQEVADYLALSRTKLYQMMDAGELPYLRLGRCRRIRWADVHAFVEQCRAGDC